jgi:hypothetical protein
MPLASKHKEIVRRLAHTRFHNRRMLCVRGRDSKRGSWADYTLRASTFVTSSPIIWKRYCHPDFVWPSKIVALGENSNADHRTSTFRATGYSESSGQAWIGSEKACIEWAGRPDGRLVGNIHEQRHPCSQKERAMLGVHPIDFSPPSVRFKSEIK